LKKKEKFQCFLVSGIPATGKTGFGKYLVKNHGFVHFDLEEPEIWPAPELHSIWNVSRSKFVDELSQRYKKVILDWGFPVHCTPWVLELKQSGVILIWFTGDIRIAKELFRKREGEEKIEIFERQVHDISKSGLPETIDPKIIEVFNPNRVPRDPSGIFTQITERD